MQVLKNKGIKAILFFAVFAIGSLAAQSNIGIQAPPFKQAVFQSPNKLITFQAPDLELEKAPMLLKTPYYSPHWKPKPFNSDLATDILNVAAFINSFNADKMPFFCRIEYQHEQAARFPVKFRLGEVQYVDRLEQKVDWELGN